MLRFIRYGFMPNRLGYCGPDRNNLLFQYGVEGAVDPELPPLLTQFLGPLPYLKAIASGSGIDDIFDERVVEAYWIGNELLEHVRARELYEALQERFRKQLSPRMMELVAGKVPSGARPHHSFHVFDVWRQAGRLDGNVLGTMDNCRISWGTVQSVDGGAVMVDRRPLIMRDGGLGLGQGQPYAATRLLEGKGFVSELMPGDVVTMHWGWICERLSGQQLAQLERYTRMHMRLASQTL